MFPFKVIHLVYQGSTNTYTITDYSSFSVYTVSADYGTATIVDETITLNVPTPSTEPQIALTIIKDGKPTTFVVAVRNKCCKQTIYHFPC